MWQGNVLGRAMGSASTLSGERYRYYSGDLSLHACVVPSLQLFRQRWKNRHTGSADQCQNLSAEPSESKSHIESRRLKQSLCRHGAQRHPCAGEHRCFDGDGVPG